MSSAPPLDLDALSLADLKKLVVQLLTRVAVLEEENQRLRGTRSPPPQHSLRP
jgi:hypothetical protein